jgi:hypothetical protein
VQLVANRPGLDTDTRRQVVLHELGHLLFGFGESGDPTSVMFLPLTVPTMPNGADVSAALAAFAVRDGAP